jgi:hypothetical protein
MPVLAFSDSDDLPDIVVMESRMRGDAHVRFGGRSEETGWPKCQYRALLRPYELEISVLSRQCLKRRIADRDSLMREVAAWQQRRNQDGITTKWRFTVNDARRMLPHLYPETS